MATTLTDISCIPVSELEQLRTPDNNTLFLASQFDQDINQYVSKKLTADDLSLYLNQNTNYVDKTEATTDIGLGEPYYYVTGIQQRDGKITGLLSAHFPAGGTTQAGTGVIDGTLATSQEITVNIGEEYPDISYDAKNSSWIAIRGQVTLQSANKMTATPTLNLYIGNNLINQVELDGIREEVYFTSVNWFGIPVKEGTILTLKLIDPTTEAAIPFTFVPGFTTKVGFYEYKVTVDSHADEAMAAYVQKAAATFTDSSTESQYVKLVHHDNGLVRPVHAELPVWDFSLHQSFYDERNAQEIAYFTLNGQRLSLFAPTAYNAVLKRASKIEQDGKTYIRLIFNEDGVDSEPITLDITKFIPDISGFPDIDTSCPILPLGLYKIATNTYGQVVRSEAANLGAMAYKNSINYETDILASTKPTPITKTSQLTNDSGFIQLSAIENPVNTKLTDYVKKNQIDAVFDPASASDTTVPSTSVLKRELENLLSVNSQLTAYTSDVSLRKYQINSKGVIVKAAAVTASDLPSGIPMSKIEGLESKFTEYQPAGSYITADNVASQVTPIINQKINEIDYSTIIDGVLGGYNAFKDQTENDIHDLELSCGELADEIAAITGTSTISEITSKVNQLESTKAAAIDYSDSTDLENGSKTLTTSTPVYQSDKSSLYLVKLHKADYAGADINIVLTRQEYEGSSLVDKSYTIEVVKPYEIASGFRATYKLHPNEKLAVLASSGSATVDAVIRRFNAVVIATP